MLTINYFLVRIKQSVKFFSVQQLDIIHRALTTGKLGNADIALVLPQLVAFIFHSDKALKEALMLRYGPKQADVLQGLGADVLAGDDEAREMVETLLSRTRKDH